MRIVDTYNIGPIKCTLFIHEAEYTLKMEDQYGAVQYKLKQLDKGWPENIQTLLRIKDVQKEVITSFRAMRKGRDLLLSMLSSEGDSMEEII